MIFLKYLIDYAFIFALILVVFDSFGFVLGYSNFISFLMVPLILSIIRWTIHLIFRTTLEKEVD